jgi:hypothetical protein
MIKLLETKEEEGEEDRFLGFKHKFPSITPRFSSVSHHTLDLHYTNLKEHICWRFLKAICE